MATSETLRQRRAAVDGSLAPTADAPGPAKRDAGRARRAPAGDPRPATGVALLSTFLVILAFYGAVRMRSEILRPRPERFGASSAERSAESRFDVAEAMRHVATIAGKPRWVGSKALDESLEYVRKEIEALKGVASSNGMLLEVETSVMSGSYPSAMGTTSVVISYSDVLSVVARLSPREVTGAEGPGRSLLVNGHVDSAWGSPGANDCAACVAIGMESLRSIARTPTSVTGLSRPIVFLFNGAEEPLLAGAHAFVTGHRWAADIEAHINLESMGSGKKFSLFQVGPGNQWLAEAYAKAVKQPWASVTGSDIFDLGVIPGETDFRIFKEHGIPGYDFALLENGAIYHTRHDDFKHVTRESLAYGGQNVVIPLALELAGTADAIGKHLLHVTAGGDAPSLAFQLARFLPSLKAVRPGWGARAVFFDVSGLVAFVYSDSMARCLVWALAVASLVAWSGAVPIGIASVEASGRLSSRLRMFGCVIYAIVAGIASATSAAMFYVHVLARPLSWYASSRFALAVYAPPSVVGATVALQLTLPRDCPPKKAGSSMHMAVTLLYSLLMVVMTIFGALAAFIPMLLALAFLVAVFLPLRQEMVFLRFLSVLVPVSIVGFLSAWDGIGVFVGLFGRTGNTPADVAVSAIVSFYTLIYGLVPILPLYAYYRHALPRIRKYFIIFAIMVATLVAMLPELTLPHRNEVYSKDAPKRIMAIHFHSPEQQPPDTLALVPMDTVPIDVNTTVRMLPFSDKNALADIPQWGKAQSNLLEAARPFMSFLAGFSVFDVEERVRHSVPTAEVVSENVDPVDPRNVTVKIAVSAPDAMQISVRLPLKDKGGVVESWSLSSELKDMGDSGGVWVRHVGRGEGSERLVFSVLVRKPSESADRPPIVFDVSSSRPGKSRSETLGRLYFPQWAAPVFVQGTGAGFSL